MKCPATVYRALRDAAQAHDVELNLLAAITYQESGWNPLAIEDLDAGVSLGLGQLNLAGAGSDWRASGNAWALLGPQTNARASAIYLWQCWQAYPDDVARAVASYNAGVGGVSGTGWRGVNPGYVSAVLGFYDQIQREGLEEDWDPAVTGDLREYGKTLWDCAVNLLGIARMAVGKCRQVAGVVAGV